jgi:hypothetical protein
MIFKIKKGNHRSYNIPKITLKKNLFFNFSFLSNPSYITENKQNQDDINKIFGISDSFHHHCNSIRIGWNYNIKLDKNILYIYYYINGERKFIKLDNIYLEENREYNGFIEIYKNYYFIKIEDKYYKIERKSKWIGPRYFLYPYFGGQETTKKEIQIQINYKII